MVQRTTIIAEAGVNHDGSLDKAFALVDAAAAAGADIVKFQTFKADALATNAAPKAAYQKHRTGEAESQLDMLRRLELPRDAYRPLMERAEKRGIGFLSTPFDHESLAFLISLGLPRVKIGSGDTTNAPLLLEAARSGRDVILSTGMSTLAEVEESLGVLAYGYGQVDEQPGRAAFRRAWSNAQLRSLVAKRVVLLHCTTEYPCSAEDVNLRAMDTMSRAFAVPIGYSDHTDGAAVSIAAVARGAEIIEKHLTLDRRAVGPDHAASLEPDAFRDLGQAIRAIEVSLGDGIKVPRPSEIANIPVARKSLVAARTLRSGTVLTAADIICKRPGGHRPPIEYWDLLGQTVTGSRNVDDPL